MVAGGANDCRVLDDSEVLALADRLEALEREANAAFDAGAEFNDDLCQRAASIYYGDHWLVRCDDVASCASCGRSGPRELMADMKGISSVDWLCGACLDRLRLAGKLSNIPATPDSGGEDEEAAEETAVQPGEFFVLSSNRFGKSRQIDLVQRDLETVNWSIGAPDEPTMPAHLWPRWGE